MQDWKTYLQPAATLAVALSLGAIAVDQYRTSNARFKCAQVFARQVEGDVAPYLGLKEGGENWNNFSGYCRAFISPANSGGGYASVDIPSTIDVKITDMPNVYGDVGIAGQVSVDGDIRTCDICGR